MFFPITYTSFLEFLAPHFYFAHSCQAQPTVVAFLTRSLSFFLFTWCIHTFCYQNVPFLSKLLNWENNLATLKSLEQQQNLSCCFAWCWHCYFYSQCAAGLWRQPCGRRAASSPVFSPFPFLFQGGLFPFMQYLFQVCEFCFLADCISCLLLCFQADMMLSKLSQP